VRRARPNPREDKAAWVDQASRGRAWDKHRRALERALAQLPPEERARVDRDVEAWLAFVRREAPGSLEKLGAAAGRVRRARAVKPAQSLEGLPRAVYHGTEKLGPLVLDGLRLPPAEKMGRSGKRGWGWSSGSYRWGGETWRWFQSLTDEGRATVERETLTKIESVADLGRAVSLLFVMTADPMYAQAYAPRHSRDVIEFDTRRLPVLGYFKDPHVMGDPLVLVLPARGFQGGPDAIAAVHTPD
jgi:hypothetical protein